MAERIDNQGRRLRPWPRNPEYLVREDGVILHPRKGQLTVSAANGGYLSVSLRGARLHGGKTHTVASVVCETFHGPRPSPDHQAAHEDGDKRNNSAGNLTWKTRVENAADKIRHGTVTRPFAKLTEDEVREIRTQSAEGQSRRDIATKYGVDERTVSDIRTGRTWGHVV